MGWFTIYQALIGHDQPDSVAKALEGEAEPLKTLAIALGEIDRTKPELNRSARARIRHWRVRLEKAKENNE